MGGLLAVLALAACVLCLPTAHGAEPAPLPSAEAIREAVDRVIEEGPYDLEPKQSLMPSFEWLKDLLKRIADFFDPVLGAASPAVAWTIIGLLVLILFALLAHILWSFYRAIQVPQEHDYLPEEAPLGDPEQLSRQAQTLAEARRYGDAARLLYNAALALLEAERSGRVLVALTTSEYLKTFRTPWVIENLRVFADLINWKWYGDRAIDEDDYSRCRNAYDALSARLAEREQCSAPAS